MSAGTGAGVRRARVVAEGSLGWRQVYWERWTASLFQPVEALVPLPPRSQDVANMFAPSVAARALTMKQALLVAGVFEFTGAILMVGGAGAGARLPVLDARPYASGFIQQACRQAAMAGRLPPLPPTPCHACRFPTYYAGRGRGGYHPLRHHPHLLFLRLP